MKIHIEDAKSEDAKGLAILLGQLGYPVADWEAMNKIQLQKSPTYKLLVAKEENQVLGFIALHFYHAFHLPAPVGRITAFCVNERVRGSGIGSLLLTTAEDFFHQHHCYKIEVTSNLKRTSTHQYYLQRGFTETSRHFVKLFGKKNS